MGELFRIVLEMGLFFIGCTVVFLVGFIVDAWAQARGGTGAPAPQGAEVAVRTPRTRDPEGDGLEPAPVARAA